MLRRHLALPLIALAALVALLFAAAWIPLRQARAAWEHGRDAEAIDIAQRWSKLHLWPAQYHQILAASYLTSGAPAAARPHLGAIGSPWIAAVSKDDVARRLFVRDRYADFLAYDAASRERSESGDVALDRAAALASTNRLQEAQRVFASVDRARVDPNRHAALQRAIAARAAGSVPYVFDRNGGAIGLYRPSSQDVVASNDDFAPFIERGAGELTIGAHLPLLGANASIETTLDPVVQRAALRALGSYRGSLVAIDPRTNEVLAMASSRGSGPLADLALERQYEPGSVIKVLTGLNAIGDFDVNSMFPYVCKGDLIIDGRHFADWVTQGHGPLRNIDEALAVSCNIFFAELGVRLGRDRLHRFMTAAGFDGQADFGLFQVPLGRTVGRISDDYETALYAIGLRHETMNALHMAMIASMMANRGVLTTPRVLLRRRSILGDVVGGPPPQGRSVLARREAAESMIRAMQAVVDAPRGTGRRAPVEGISIAMKTGTAGKRKNGLEALIMAFAPVDSPKIAFGIIAEDAGPAEFAGAQIAHDFLEALRGRL